MAVLKRQPKPTDPTWAGAVHSALCRAASILAGCGRRKDAAVAYEEMLGLERGARMDRCPLTRMNAAQVNVLLGRFERAVELGRECEQVLDACKTGRQYIHPQKLPLLERGFRPIVYATLASAYEWLGRQPDCDHYHNRALAISRGGPPGVLDVMTCHDRAARRCLAAGDLAAAEQHLAQPFDFYKAVFDRPSRFG
jgi:tetratricopeptide (TPR) repeat protein